MGAVYPEKLSTIQRSRKYLLKLQTSCIESAFLNTSTLLCQTDFFRKVNNKIVLKFLYIIWFLLIHYIKV